MSGIFEKLVFYFQYPFVWYALIVGVLIALCSSLLGVTLVLKRFSFIGDGLSHVAFGAMAIASVLNFSNNMLFVMPVTVICAVLLLRTGQSTKIKGDAAIALISTTSLAVGVMVISLTTGMNTDVCNYLFGSILSMSQSDVNLSVVLSVILLVLFVLFYNRIFAVTFDESFAKATGTNAGLYNMLIALLTALIIVLGMRMMGALLITSLIVFPALTSMRLCTRFKAVIINSAIISVLCLWVGLTISYVYATPTGASTVLCNIIVFFLYWIIQSVKGVVGHA